MTIRAAFLSTAVFSLLATAGCERTATNHPDELAEEEEEWAPPEGNEIGEEGEVDEEKAPFLSARKRNE